MAKLTVLCARSMHVAVGALGRAFAQGAGHEIDFDFGTVGGLQAKLDAGETADVVILSAAMIDRLEQAGALVAGSRKDVANTFIAVCLREGAPAPDFKTADAFRRVLERATTIAISDPAAGGSAGVHLAKSFEAAGLAGMLKEKSLPQPTGAEVARRVVEGTAEFGLTLSGEIASVPGAVVAGPLPPPFGQDTTYCAAVMAGSSEKQAAGTIIAALTRPDTRATWEKAGFALPSKTT
jgi:molybdate transport system substrate-binding protein